MTITGYFLNTLRSDYLPTNISAKYQCDFQLSYYWDRYTYKYQFNATSNPNNNQQLVLVYPQGVGNLTGQLAIDGVNATGIFTPNYGNITVVSYEQPDVNSPKTMVMTVTNFVSTLSWIQYYPTSSSSSNYRLDLKWINATSFNFTLEPSIYSGYTYLFHSPERIRLISGNYQPDVIIYPRSSLNVLRGVSTKGGLLPVNATIFSMLKSCTIGSKTVAGPFDGNNITIPAGVGLQVPLNCNDSVGNALLTTVYFNYGPLIGAINPVGNKLAITGVNFPQSTFIRLLQDGTQLNATSESTPTLASFVISPLTPITGTLNLTSSGITVGPYPYKGKPWIDSVVISPIYSPSTIVDDAVQLTFSGCFLNIGTYNYSVTVGSTTCIDVKNFGNGQLTCVIPIPSTLPSSLPVVITINSISNDPYTLQIPLSSPSITSITPNYTLSSTIINVHGNVNGALLVNSNGFIQQSCSQVSPRLITCTLNGPDLSGSVKAYILGLYSAPISFNFNSTITGSSFINDGSSLTITGNQFSPYAYFTRQGVNNLYPTFVTSNLLVITLPPSFQSGSFNVASSGYQSNSLMLTLQPNISTLSFDQYGMLITGQYLDLKSSDSNPLPFNLSVNSVPLTVVSFSSNQINFTIQRPLSSSNGTPLAMITKLSVLGLTSTLQSTLSLPFIQTSTYNHIDQSVVFTGMNIDMFNVIIDNNGVSSDHPLNSWNQSLSMIQFQATGESILSFTLTSANNTIISNTITLHVLIPSITTVLINDNNSVTVQGNNLLGDQCNGCLDSCNFMTYNNGITNYSTPYSSLPKLMNATSNGTLVNIIKLGTTCLSCASNTISNSHLNSLSFTISITITISNTIIITTT
ncbi:hypothetical protein SAMD00019534_077020 [Acytostelium subglobosum LB1]|uniref:hypothetical protein n=1 Tax=Acytostelium subglobosum LB1 TaxID=1410327 RepID=UPI000644EACF|nr:hypothetical protein SAMD00019534_077020 [Acytostelium subglobosum LB1]GAM24527.1 hypothetical protein SAMD00019534_077020 [Acytostelium subglobosum LB1]|eukprot:XP_012752853.1 hypothetical protein SAMD00019534_077020 [Acytostelium subglobosum LB1]